MRPIFLNNYHDEWFFEASALANIGFKNPNLSYREVISNVSYARGAFDGVKLGGVRLDLDIICGEHNSRCDRELDQQGKQIIGTDNKLLLKKDVNGNHIFIGDAEYRMYQDLIKNHPKASDLYGATGGFQAEQGGWYLPKILGGTIPYKVGSISDKYVEAFAGTHDYTGGQMWGWYGKDGNTSRGRGWFEKIGSSTTTVVAIPTTAPFALSEILSSDVVQLIFKLGK